MLLELVFPLVLHAITILNWTEVQTLVTCHARGLVRKNGFVAPMFQRACFLVLKDAFYLNVLLDDVVDITI